MKAYITLFSTNEYIYGLIGLMYSWKRTNPKYPFYVIVTPEITEYNKDVLRKIGYNIIEKDNYVPKKYKEDLANADNNMWLGESKKDWSESGWHHCWTKYEIFGLTQFEKLVYIDSDTFVLQNLDELFDKPHMSAPHETRSYYEGKPSFSAALMVIEPNKDLYNKLIEFADNAISENNTLIADQDVLNKFFPDWSKSPELVLPYYYHANWFMFHISKDNQHLGYVYNSLFDTKAIHMVGSKPWKIGKQTYSSDWILLTAFQNYYIDYLNYCLEDMYSKSIAAIPLIR